MTKLLVPIVGAHYNPPAKQLLAGLPSGVPLRLQPEPDNPYDENAVLVHLAARDIPKDARARVALELEGTGTELEDLLSDLYAPITLGHCAASGGKPIAKLQAGCSDKLSGTLEVHAAGSDQYGVKDYSTHFKCSLVFLPDGSPAVEVLS